MLRLREATGYGRMGSQVRAALEALVADLERQGRIRRCGDAWLGPEPCAVAPRDRSGLPAAERKVEYVPHVEIAAAVRRVVANAFGIGPDECAREALELLGFRGVRDRSLQRALAVIQTLVGEGVLAERDGALRISENPGA
jgi:hypothetical protein